MVSLALIIPLDGLGGPSVMPPMYTPPAYPGGGPSSPPPMVSAGPAEPGDYMLVWRPNYGWVVVKVPGDVAPHPADAEKKGLGRG